MRVHSWWVHVRRDRAPQAPFVACHTDQPPVAASIRLPILVVGDGPYRGLCVCVCACVCVSVCVRVCARARVCVPAHERGAWGGGDGAPARRGRDEGERVRVCVAREYM